MRASVSMKVEKDEKREPGGDSRSISPLAADFSSVRGWTDAPSGRVVLVCRRRVVHREPELIRGVTPGDTPSRKEHVTRDVIREQITKVFH